MVLGGYRLIEPLGGGGIASVYKAFDTSTMDRFVAVKVLRAYFSQERELLKNFHQELAAIVRLQHPNILPVLDFGEDEGASWLAMEYASGGSLKDRLNGPMELDETVEIISQIASALDYANSQGILHRNIKPSNVFFRDDGQVLLADFGMAGLGEGAHPLMKTALSTPMPEYMSPEQAEGEAQDRRSDIYSLAVLLYLMLTGSIPYYATTPMVAYAKQMAYAPDPPSALNPAVSREVDSVILRAIAVLPEERYATAGEFVRDLRRAMGIQEAGPAAMEPEGAGAPAPVPATETRSVETTEVREGWLICPVCWVANTADRRHCAACWANLSEVALSNEAEKKAWDRRRLRRKLIRRMTRVAVVAALAGLVVGVVSYVSFTSTPEPLPAPTSQLSSASASGDWAMFRHDPMGTGFDGGSYPQPQGKLKWKFSTDAPMRASPAVVGGAVYAATGDRRIIALNAQDGSLRWEYAVTGPVDSSPAVAGDLVYVGLRDGSLLAIDTATGNLRWEFRTGNPIYSSPSIADGVLFVGSGDGNLYALDAATGKLRWKAKTQGWVTTVPAVGNGIVYSGSRDGRIYMVDIATGATRLAYETGRAVESSPVVADNRVYLGNDIGRLYALDGTERERFMERPMLWAWRQLYIWQMAPPSPPDRGFIWAFRAPRARIGSSPALVGDKLYFGADNGKVYSLNKDNGEQLWESSVEHPVTYSSPAVVGETLYIGTDGGRLYALDAATGQKKWNFATGGPIESSPAVAGGVVYVTSMDGSLYAIN